MQLGLCMIVKDEARQIEDCLGDIYDLFAQISVVDTGSTDETRTIFASRFGVRPVSCCPRTSAGFLDFSAARNMALSGLRTPWVLSLDADERVSRRELERLVARLPDAGGAVAGYHCRWLNHDGEGGTYLDDKLALFERRWRYRGSIHESVKHEIRAAGARAAWLDGLTIHHHRDPSAAAGKLARYREQLHAAIVREPRWYRYHWFLGYTYFRTGELDQATTYLSVAAEARSRDFPVECLNSAVVLAAIHAKRGARAELERRVRAALEFWAEVARDFEVEGNRWLRPWLERALVASTRRQLEEIRAHDFAC